MRRIAWALPAAAALVCGCGAGASAPQATSQPPSPAPASHQSQPAATRASAKPAPGKYAASAKAQQDAASGGPELFRPNRTGILSGKVVAVDPGHNGGNFAAASVIGKLIWNGRKPKPATPPVRRPTATTPRPSSTGTSSCTSPPTCERKGDGHAHPHQQHRGGTVRHRRAASATKSTPTRPSPSTPTEGRRRAGVRHPGAGRRRAHDAIIGPSVSLGADLRSAFASGTGSLSAATTEPAVSSPATTPASTCPPFKVFIECANMQRHRRRPGHVFAVASHGRPAIAAGLTAFLTGAGHDRAWL
jgi:N-acetylmuramoyl-L-alanine amidase